MAREGLVRKDVMLSEWKLNFSGVPGSLLEGCGVTDSKCHLGDISLDYSRQ